MKSFIGKNYLLGNETAKTLYHEYASAMPILDYHCHVSPEEIAMNRRFDNIAQLMLGGDHYKWRLIRANGEEERLVTGHESSDYEKFLAFAKALPKAVGNPVHAWTHLELKRYFDCDLVLSPKTADEIWKTCNTALTHDALSVRGIIERSNVVAIATTDDPSDSLEWHKRIAEDESFATKVVPAFRPDKAINIDKPGFAEYIEKLGRAAQISIKNLDDLRAALENRIGYFDSMGCRASDHGIETVPYKEDAENAAWGIFEKALAGGAVSAEEADSYKTALLLFLARQYAKRNWAMEIHYGAQRNINSALLQKAGPEAGNDAIGSRDCSSAIASLLDKLAQTGELPKTILFSLNQNDDAMLDTIAGCFPGAGIVSKVQHGAAWWFHDSKPGMENQLISLATRGLLGGFLGMLTDSRSFLSYTRHEYFRRILCNLLGTWVENGEYPDEIPTLGKIVQDISYNNAAEYFGF